MKDPAEDLDYFDTEMDNCTDEYCTYVMEQLQEALSNSDWIFQDGCQTVSEPGTASSSLTRFFTSSISNTDSVSL